ncbi:hypothetical protein SSU98_0891 [Streptococcus suis 98HAH33]|nr:hypothetical protein SSU98_0891 [Streptococcus suis 98HAH33]
MADIALSEYEADLAKGIEPISWEEMLEELGLTDEDLL